MSCQKGREGEVVSGQIKRGSLWWSEVKIAIWKVGRRAKTIIGSHSVHSAEQCGV